MLRNKGTKRRDLSCSLQKRKAAISTEVAIGIVLTVAVLFLAMGLFNGNLKNMLANSGISNLWSNNGQKADWSQKKAVDLTQAQKFVQLTGEQGLEDYLTRAQAAIEKYKANPPKTEAEVEDLAKQATIAKIGDVLSSEDKLFFQDKYNIKIDDKVNYETKITNTNKRISFNDKRNFDLNEPLDQLSVIREISEKNF